MQGRIHTVWSQATQISRTFAESCVNAALLSALLVRQKRLTHCATRATISLSGNRRIRQTSLHLMANRNPLKRQRSVRQKSGPRRLLVRWRYSETKLQMAGLVLAQLANI